METWKYQLTVVKLQKTADVVCESKQFSKDLLLPEGENQWQSTRLLRYAKNHMI